MGKALVLAAILGLATLATAHADSANQKWRPGWDYFGEQLDYKNSKIAWAHASGSSALALNYTLRGATPNRQYQVGIHFFDRCLASFGQFPVLGACSVQTREGVARLLSAAELGVVTTDSKGNGAFSLVVNGIEPGSYEVEFEVRGGAGCNLGGCGSCGVIFESPGPYGTTTSLVFP